MLVSDASFANNIETRRSLHGYTISLFSGLIIWKATRQDTVTTSTTEAELLGVAQLGKEVLALKRFFFKLCFDLCKLWRIFCDNTQTIRLIVGNNMRINTKLRHVDIHNIWLRQEYAKGNFEVTYLATDVMPVDGLTKNLSRQKFEHFKALLNLQDIRGRVKKLD